MTTPQALIDHAMRLLPSGVAVMSHTSSANVRWANSTITTNGLSDSGQMTVVAFEPSGDGIATGSSGGVVTSPDDVAALVARARAAAAGSGPTTEAMDLPDAIVSGSWDLPAELTGADVLRPISAPLGDVMRAGTGTGTEYFGYAEHTVDTTWLATTTGTRVRHVQPTSRFELSGKAEQRTRSAWAGWAGRDFGALDVHGLDRQIRQGLDWQRNSVEVKPGHHRAILSPSAVADLLACYLWAAAAREAHEGRGAFAAQGGTRIGQRVSQLPVLLRTDPHDAQVPCADVSTSTHLSSTSSPFDAGLPIEATDWISDGTIQRLATTRRTSMEAAIPHAAVADNLIAEVPGHAGSLDDLVARTDDGLLLTCLWYIRDVDPASLLLTGLTRDGVYVVRGGEVIGTAGNFRFNESPLGMLGRISDAGAPVPCLPREWADWFTRARTAPLVVDGFNFSTASDAL